MRLYLINPANPLVAFIKANDNRWNQYRVWKPLGLLAVAALTPRDWDITVIDENLGPPDYARLPRPDLVGITAFTSQATRAYKLAAIFRQMGVPVILGGIHASMCTEEALEHADTVVTGEAESIWATVLDDARAGTLKPRYDGTRIGLENVPVARHDLLRRGYRFGSIQVTRGCPLNCTFCSVTAFNGGLFRHRPIDIVLEELRQIREKYVLIVDDNFIGTRRDHIAYTKELLRAIIKEKFNKLFMTQVTINLGDDEELLELSAKAGIFGVYIGFEASTPEGLEEVHKKFNLQKGRDIKASVRRIQRHRIMVAGSFIMGLDTDQEGIGAHIAETANDYGVDTLNVMFMTPLPGTELWRRMEQEDRIAANRFPEDWKYYTLTYPVAKFKHLSWADLVRENQDCSRAFYSYRRIARRVVTSTKDRRLPWLTLVGNLSNRSNSMKFHAKMHADLDLTRGELTSEEPGARLSGSHVPQVAGRA